MAVPSTVKRYAVKQHVSELLKTATVEGVTKSAGHEVPEEGSAEYAAWDDAIEYVRVRLVS